MKWIVFVFVLFTGFLLSCSNKKTRKTGISKKPNVLLILTDDQGYGDMGFTGNPDIQTPNMDKLARQSLRFTNFYVCPVCAPTRSSIMTGRYHPRTGIYDTYNGGATMATEEVTLAEILRDNGYATGIFGKWHLGDNYPYRPQDQGFSVSLVHRGGGMGQVGDIANYFHYDSSYFNPTLFENGLPVEKKGFCTDIFAGAAIQFILQHQNEPFFVYLPFNAPHTPLQVPGNYYEMYKNLKFDTDRYMVKGYPIKGFNERAREDTRKVYSMVTNIDDNLGRIFEVLDDLHLRKNTLVIFLTDNGPQQIRYTAGLRGRKGSVYEGGIRVPCFMDIPGGKYINREIKVPAAHIDLLPTILDYCKIEQPSGLQIDGENLWPVIEGKKADWAGRSLFFHWIRGMPEPYRNIAVRKGDFKLVGHAPYDTKGAGLELFNLKEDPFEMENLAEQMPVKVKGLKADFDRYYDEIIRISHLASRRIQIGSVHENPVLLNRNDAKGPPGIWAQDQLYAYWAVSVKEERVCDIRFVFRESLPGPGNMLVKVGSVQRTIHIADTGTSVVDMKKVPLLKGDYMFEAWFNYKGKPYLPFYVEVSW